MIIELLSLLAWPVTVIIVLKQVQDYLRIKARDQKELAKYQLEIKNHTAIDDLKSRVDSIDAKIVSIQNGLQWTK